MIEPHALPESCEFRWRNEASQSISLRDFVFDRWAAFTNSASIDDYYQHAEKAEMIVMTDQGSALMTLYLQPGLESREVLVFQIVAAEQELNG